MSATGDASSGFAAFLGLDINTTEAYMLSLVWPKIFLCGQQIQGFVPNIIWCWWETYCPEGLNDQGSDPAREEEADKSV